MQQRLYSYVGGIVRNYEGSLIEIGGMPDHVHLLIKLNNLDIFSSLIRDVKAHSSLWVHKNFPQLKDFAWQEGYASYSVSGLDHLTARTFGHNRWLKPSIVTETSGKVTIVRKIFSLQNFD